jgi:hypothetical protein
LEVTPRPWAQYAITSSHEIWSPGLSTELEVGSWKLEIYDGKVNNEAGHQLAALAWMRDNVDPKRRG